ncbi:Hypothetical protein NTJ_09740 [Nesidiocoris tenuis]|uniref:Uncharacterized protein n=1 Tax=Nesidiocoris tenuis TaxID=355587 RepID=A0ABN7AXL5_9HEMI|nr:Hypothetical protein NTJ_09740 [Nesidiocoris tenuis]
MEVILGWLRRRELLLETVRLKIPSTLGPAEWEGNDVYTAFSRRKERVPFSGGRSGNDETTTSSPRANKRSAPSP